MTNHDNEWWTAHIAIHESKGVDAPSMCCYYDDEPVEAS